MRSASTFVCVCSLALGSVAHAQDPQTQLPDGTPAPATATAPAAISASGYPTSFLDRPLILPTFKMQQALFFTVDYFTTDSNGDFNYSTSLNLAFDTGISDKLQAGAVFVLETSLNFGLNVFLVNGQYNVLDFLNVRLDLGVARHSFSIWEADFGELGFAFGVGAPLRYRVTPRIAIISGHPYSYGYGDDIIGIELLYDGNKVINFNIPVGVLVQFHEMIAGSVRTGYRLALLSPAMGSSFTLKFVPLGFDVYANVRRVLDVGLTFELAGELDSGVTLPGGATGRGYADDRMITLWAQARFR